MFCCFFLSCILECHVKFSDIFAGSSWKLLDPKHFHLHTRALTSKNTAWRHLRAGSKETEHRLPAACKATSSTETPENRGHTGQGCPAQREPGSHGSPTLHAILTMSIEVVVGIPADEGVRGVIVYRDTGPILQVFHACGEPAGDRGDGEDKR